MKTNKLPRHALTLLVIACALFALLISGCQAAKVSAVPPAVQPAAPLPTPTETQALVEPTQIPASLGIITLDLAAVNLDQTLDTVAAVPPTEDTPWHAAAPQYHRVTLGYPVSRHSLKPQVFIYPVEELASYNEVAGQMATDLQALLEDQHTVDQMPFLPLSNSAQMMHTQVQYMDFKNGSGVRYLTQYSQGMVPINNVDLFYTFQGLTSDGKFYVAAVLPVNHPELPATQEIQVDVVESGEYQDNLADTVDWLGQQPGDSFTPDLAKLDALVQSFEVE